MQFPDSLFNFFLIGIAASLLFDFLNSVGCDESGQRNQAYHFA